MNQSEVARLREQIELQIEAMQRGMHGFSTGATRHAFIRARLERLDQYHAALTRQIGEEDANQVVYGLCSEVMAS